MSVCCFLFVFLFQVLWVVFVVSFFFLCQGKDFMNVPNKWVSNVISEPLCSGLRAGDNSVIRLLLEAGRDFWRPSSPTHLQGSSLQQVTVVDIQKGLGYLCTRRLHLVSGPRSGLWHLHCKEVLPFVCVELPMLQILAVAPCPITGHC